MIDKTTKPFILVDGSSYLFRAYYALPPLTTTRGYPTGAIYGVINMLRKIMVQYQPKYIAVIFDPQGKTFRNELYSEYKANRRAMPSELSQQIQPLFEIIKALGLPLIVKDGYEADDVIATLAKRATEEGLPVLVSTSDKDLAQIVNDNVTLVNTMTNILLTPLGVVEKFGVPPERIIDYLSLIGDNSDNIPGVPKVGPKTAAKWLNKYGSLENIKKQAYQIKGKVGENLRAHLHKFPLMRQLLTVISDLPLEERPTDLKLGPRNQEKLLQLFTTYEFKSWIKEILQEAVTYPTNTHYVTVFDRITFELWIKRLINAQEIALNVLETTNSSFLEAKLIGLSFAITPNEAAYIPIGHDYANAPIQLEKKWVLERLKPIIRDPKKVIIGINLKRTSQLLAKEGLNIGAKMYDVQMESYVLDSSRHHLDTLCLRYLGRSIMKFEDLVGKSTKRDLVCLDKAASYASEVVDLTLQLHHKLMLLIEKEKALKQVFESIEIPIMPILIDMEMHGVLIDIQMLHSQSNELRQRINQLEREAYKLAGREFNLSSPKQLQNILYRELNIQMVNKTPGGQPSTAEHVLQDLARHYPLPKIILEHRRLSKLKSTYTDRLPKQVSSLTGRVHTSYNQTVTSTGRLSSNNPNLQNIPIRTYEGRKIRRAFIAPCGFRIVAADYSQVELRVIAHISQDPGLIKAFEKEWDIHSATASEVFGVPLKEVTLEQRRRAKAINFGLLYGMSSFGLGRQLGIARELAQEYINIYFRRYPKVYEYMQEIRTIAAEQGYVETLFGRRVYLPDINAPNLRRRQAAERAAINAPMQGTAADIIKIAMIKINDCLKHHRDAHLIMQVHDELVFELSERDLDGVVLQIKKAMEEAVSLSVPLVVEIGVGRNWEEAH